MSVSWQDMVVVFPWIELLNGSFATNRFCTENCTKTQSTNLFHLTKFIVLSIDCKLANV